MAKTNYLLNSLHTSVRDNLLGLALTNPHVQISPNVDALIRKDVEELRKKKQVLVISGGGAGHEPMFAGFVGPHSLTAAISGSYFASPPAGQIIKLVEQIATSDTEILLLLANYTGDRLNFGLAKEQLAMKGFSRVEMFVFGDDIAPYLTATKQVDERNRRGLAGIVFIHKIAGVLSERGKSLAEIQSSLDQFSKLIHTISISLSAADIPGHGASFQLGRDCMELGLGVHGESGVKRIGFRDAKQTIQLLLAELTNYLNKQGNQFDGRRVAVLVNNLGGLTIIELNVLRKEIVEQMRQLGFVIERFYSGHFMTSFNMRGVSISVMLLNQDLLDILDCSEVTLVNSVNEDPVFHPLEASNQGGTINSTRLFRHCSPELYKQIVLNTCNSIINNQTRLNNLDGTVGDSDCGSTLASIAKLFLDRMAEPAENEGDNPLPSLAELARLVSDNIGGTSGALYSLLFTAAFNYIENENCHQVGIEFWLGLIRNIISVISMYSGARAGDRSMIDSLCGIEAGLSKCIQEPGCDIGRTLTQTVWTAANETASMKARVGRAAYVNETHITEPDAGAVAVAIWFAKLVDTAVIESAENF